MDSHRIIVAQRQAKIRRLDKKVVAREGKPILAVAYCRCGWDTATDWIENVALKAREHLASNGLPQFIAGYDDLGDDEQSR